jgi:membrane-associated phospholipid phosphatase
MRSFHQAPLHSTFLRLVRDALHWMTVGTRLQERRLKATEVSADQEIGRARAFLMTYATALGTTALAFITLALLVRGNQLTQLDVALTRMVQAVHEPVYSWALTHASDLGWFPANAVCFGLIFIALLQLGLRLEATLAVASSLIAGVAAEGVKLWVGRMRPSAPAVHVAAHLSGYSFPSGHVIQYVTLFGFTSYVVAATWSRGVARNAILVLFAALIALVGPSRVYLGQHWPSDVVGAYLFGALWLAGTIELHLMLKRRGIGLLQQRASAGV